MRDVINKGLTEERILEAAKNAFESGWSTIKLYFILGVPYETVEDAAEIGLLAEKIADQYFAVPKHIRNKGLRITVSTSILVPKPFTPFQWAPMEKMDIVTEKINAVKGAIKSRSIVYNYHEQKTSYMEAVLARGDRRLCDVLIKAYEKGAKFDGWSEYFDFELWQEALAECNVDGDFYVYYTLDENGDAKVPRIAIRMDGKNKIGEIRGISGKQNMEPEMMPILEEKLKEFPDRDKYLKKEHDMKLLTLIDKKVNNNIELNLGELKFLYEIDDKISVFGFMEDPRIKEIKSKRNIKRDYSIIFNIKEEDVALSQEEWKKTPNKFKVLVGNLDLSHYNSLDNIVLPKYISGNLNLSLLSNANGIIFPQQVGGNLELSSLTSAEGVVLPIRVNGDLNLNRLTTANGLVLPQYIGGRLIAFDLRTIEGLKLPYGFDLKKFYYILRANGEIMNNPDKYYMKPPTEEDKKGIKK